MSASERQAYVHPEIRAQQAAQRAGAAGAGDPRALMAQMASRPLPPNVEQRTIPGPAGAPDVVVYLINSQPGTPKPAVLHMHGGGMTGGSARSSASNLATRCNEIGCVGVTVEYRLAPGTRFPHSTEDNYAALKWLYTNADALGVDRTRIAVMGESAGGGHAAMLSIMARDRGEYPILFQALMYPMLDDRSGTTRPLPAHIGNDFSSGWTALLGMPAGSNEAPYGVPGRLPDVRGLPATFVGAGSIDPTAREAIEFAQRLMEAGIFTEVCIVPGAPHAFNASDATSLARTLNGAYYGSIARAFQWRA